MSVRKSNSTEFRNRPTSTGQPSPRESGANPSSPKTQSETFRPGPAAGPKARSARRSCASGHGADAISPPSTETCTLSPTRLIAAYSTSGSSLRARPVTSRHPESPNRTTSPSGEVIVASQLPATISATYSPAPALSSPARIRRLAPRRASRIDPFDSISSASGTRIPLSCR